MGKYWYKACDSTGREFESEEVAANKQSLVENLHRQGLIPIQIKEATDSARRQIGFGQSRPARLTNAEVADFAERLAYLLTAGVELDTALSVMEENAETEKIGGSAARIRADLRAGVSLRSAIENCAFRFPAVVPPIIEVGEQSGNVAACLAEISHQQRRLDEIRQKIIAASTYPGILMGVAIVSVGIILAVVLPSLIPLFEGMGAAIPMSMAVLFHLGEFISNWWWVVTAVTAALIGWIVVKSRDAATRAKIDRALIKSPVVGRIAIEFITARFFRLLGLMLGNGLKLDKALALAIHSINNGYFAEMLDSTTEDVKSGRLLSSALSAIHLLDGEAIQLIKIAEQTGALAEFCLKIAESYEKKVEKRLSRVVSLIEPILILGISVIIGGIVFVLLSAVLSINDIAI